GYVDKVSYVKAAKVLPKMSDEQIEVMNIEYGISQRSAEKSSTNRTTEVTEVPESTLITPDGGESRRSHEA
ncbi:hypothetical protein LTS12_027712, partial [Elasticomyces elasticus]